MRHGFTLIELLVIIGIMGLMVTVGIVSVRSGQGAARIKGATRDIFGAIRHARSTALVTQKPAIITYETVEEDGEVSAKVTIDTAKLLAGNVDRSKLETLTGESTKWQQELVHIEKAEARRGKKKSETTTKSEDKTAKGEDEKSSTQASEITNTEAGDTLEDILFAPIDESVVKGVRIKVETGEEEAQSFALVSVRKSKISVFSNVDYILGKYKEKKAQEKEKNAESNEESTKSSGKKDEGGVADEMQEPVSIVWESNGRVDPHRVWIYPDGKKPEQGLMIKIDQFGAAKVYNGDGRETE